jgi:hypothetical protein
METIKLEIHERFKWKGRGFSLRSPDSRVSASLRLPSALSLSPLPGPFSDKKGGCLTKI